MNKNDLDFKPAADTNAKDFDKMCKVLANMSEICI